MSFLDALNTGKDREALESVIDHAAQVLADKIVPAIQVAGDEMVDRLAAKAELIIAEVNADLSADLVALKAEITALRALFERLDGAAVTLKLAAKS